MKRKQSPTKSKSTGKKKRNNFRVKKSKIELSDRKKQVIRLLCQQLTSKEIGRKLGLSMKTIEAHKFEIFKQIKARNKVGVAIYAIRNGIYKI